MAPFTVKGFLSCLNHMCSFCESPLPRHSEFSVILVEGVLSLLLTASIC